MNAYFELIRPGNCIMTAIAVTIGGLLAVHQFSIFWNIPIWLAIISAFLITGAGNIINDYVDIEIDKINRKNRPIPSGRVNIFNALVFSLLLFSCGIFLASLVNFLVFIIAVFNSILLAIYSFKLKNKILIGNFAIAWLVGSTFIFGAAATGSVLLAAWLGLLSGLVTVSREIVKDFEDFRGDKKDFLTKTNLKLKNIKLGIFSRFGITSKGKIILKHRKVLILVAIAFLILAVLISPLPWLYGLLSFNYLVLLAIADIVFLGCVIAIIQKRKWSKISKGIKIGMIFGLLAFLAGIF